MLIRIKSKSRITVYASFLILPPQRRILAYLIPLRILKGHLPSPELLNRFPLLRDIFSPFIAAIRQGDLRAYDQALEKWETRLLATRIPIALFHTALRISGLDIPEEEAECLVANQIYRNFLRGYISHEKQMVVLASAKTFPRVADLPSPLDNL